jgi:hypothetical protein
MPSNELRHYGVPGMKWGKRMAARSEKSREFARSNIANSGGSRKKAAAKLLGRQAAINIVTNVATMGLQAAGASPQAVQGARAARNFIQGYTNVKTAIDVTRVATVDRK